MLRIAIALAVMFTATIASAHPGDHAGLSMSAMGQHLLDWSHLPLALVSVTAGVLAFRAGWRAKARVLARKRGGS
jgi:hypothetical protein